MTLTLVTPALFEQGYRPGWLVETNDGFIGNPPAMPRLKMKLRAAATERWEPQSGWDLDAGTVTCSDGDRGCDVGETSGECLIELGMCFRVEDSRRPGCTPQRASAFEVVQPADDAPRRSADWENLRTLKAIFQAAHTSDDKNPCSPLSRLRVPAGETKIFETVTAAGQTQDLDRLTVECRPE